MMQVLVRQGQLRVHILHEPFEGLALESLSDSKPVTDIAIRPLHDVRPLGVILVFIFIHPYLVSGGGEEGGQEFCLVDLYGH